MPQKLFYVYPPPVAGVLGEDNEEGCPENGVLQMPQEKTSLSQEMQTF